MKQSICMCNKKQNTRVGEDEKEEETSITCSDNWTLQIGPKDFQTRHIY